MSQLLGIPHQPVALDLPAPARALVADAEARIKAFGARPAEQRVPAFVASNPGLVWHALRRIRDEGLAPGNRFIEWGSGFGIVTGLAALAGFAARGIEIAPALIAESRRLLADHRLPAVVETGSYLPPGIYTDEIRAERFPPADADVVYVYPWPAEARLVREVFRRFGRDGALLVSFSGGVGLEIHRRVATDAPA
jgi:hypothetical protein